MHTHTRVAARVAQADNMKRRMNGILFYAIAAASTVLLLLLSATRVLPSVCSVTDDFWWVGLGALF